MIKIINYENYTVNASDYIEICLAKLEINKVKTLLVMDKGRVLGTLTDGDVRKIIINNRLLLIPVKEAMNVDYHFGLKKEECLNIFKKYKHILMVPMVDENRNLIEIYVRD
jgi:CBS domain-containing protein